MGWYEAGGPMAVAAAFLSAAIGEGDHASGTPLDAGDPGDTARSHPLETGTKGDDRRSDPTLKCTDTSHL
jgi:hypothetical protein